MWLFYFSVQVETENYKLIYNYGLGILSSGVKFALHLVHFITNFEVKLQEFTKFFSYFLLELVRMKNSKEPCPRFLITFLLFEILAHITFLFPLKSVLTHKNHTFMRNRGHGFAQRLFSQMYITFKGIRPKIFWVRARTLYPYGKSSQKT